MSSELPAQTRRRNRPTIQRSGRSSRPCLSQRLPFDVRVNTSERRKGGGVDLPDVALYDSGGKFLVVCGEVKLPEVELEDLAASTDGHNQIGRYLASTGAVFVCNVRGFALVTVKPEWKGNGPVPRRSTRRPGRGVVALTFVSQERQAYREGSAASLRGPGRDRRHADAPIAEPESLARILLVRRAGPRPIYRRHLRRRSKGSSTISGRPWV